MYQAFSEIGYYNYDISDFKGVMKALIRPSNSVLCPKAVKIVVKGGHHGVGIRDFTPDQRESCYASLERWLNLKLTRT
jgi:hypothetical protein